MAGSHAILKANERLFKEGERADGMYLVRKGCLVVYLDRDGTEVKLAEVGPGGMIGEMAFFDQKPRSASVKAKEDTEVTQITTQDFEKLMKQIPKWFVSIMSSLSSRLRDTNARLQQTELKVTGKKAPFGDVKKLLLLLDLVWSRDGNKDGKVFSLSTKQAQTALLSLHEVDVKFVASFLHSLMEANFLTRGFDNYKNETMNTTQRSSVAALGEFIQKLQDSGYPCESITPESVLILEACLKSVASRAYAGAAITVTSISELLPEVSKDLIAKEIKQLKPFNGEFALVKVSDGIGIKADAQRFKSYVDYFRALACLSKNGLR